MTHPAPTIDNPRGFVRTLIKHCRLWLVPTVLMTLLALGYAMIRPVTWRASQALLVRDEAIGSFGRQGRFDSTDAMKAAQETISGIARNQNVLVAALEDVGPPNSSRRSHVAWPSKEDIQDLEEAIAVTPPDGAEFGSTEVIYLEVDATSRQRALDLTTAVCKNLEIALKEMRNTRARSLIVEVEKTMHLAEADLDEATARLEALESQVGSDLGELRILNDSGAGESNLRVSLTQINNELRQARAAHVASVEQEKLLSAARDHPDSLVATPNRLLESQPALRRLKDGLVDAQLRTAELLGKLNEDHPLAKAAVSAEEEIRQDLHRELEIAVRGLRTDLEISRSRLESLESQANEIKERLDGLAALRAKYSNLVAEVTQQSTIVEEARRALADARASQSAAQAVSLISRLDEPQTGNRPVGPGGGTIVLAGFGGGLLSGLGLLLLVTPPGNTRGRRWTDYFIGGRRASDRVVEGQRFNVPQASARTASQESAGRRSTDEPKRGRRATDAEQDPGRRSNDPRPPQRRRGDVPSSGRRATDPDAAVETPVHDPINAGTLARFPFIPSDVEVDERSPESLHTEHV